MKHVLHTLRAVLTATLLAIALPWCAHAQVHLHFPSLDGPPATSLDAYLFRATGTAPAPAVVFLHGCGGLLNHHGRITPRELQWAARLNEAGLHVLMVDSFGPRHHGAMCSPDHFSAAVYEARPLDAYAALRWLQAQDFVQPDRIGLMGWSEGGGALLKTIRSDNRARTVAAPAADFRAAVAFYPASCNVRRQGARWASAVPLLVLIGDGDVWTPAAPCRAVMDAATSGTSVTMQVYAGAYHDFDWPDLPVHEVPRFRTRAGVIPIEGTDAAARDDALKRVPAFLQALLGPGEAAPR